MTALIAFDAAARLGSVVAASREIGRTHGAVSKQLRNLSDDLGIKLFEREGNGLRLTEEGEQVHATIQRSLDILEAGCSEIRNRQSGQYLQIGVSPTFAGRWLMPRLPRYYARWPDSEVRLCLTGREHLLASNCDAILSWDRLSWDHTSNEHAHSLGDVSFGLVTSPGYAINETKTGLAVKTRLVRQNHSNIWDAWGQLAGTRVTARRTIPYPQTVLVLEAAANGLGVAVAERRLVEDELDDGRLVAPLGFHTIKGGLAVLVTKQNWQRPDVAGFIDWIAEEVRA
ncbi:MAG: LysR substrate-binding domain-containing protein [Pseudomonadota bacterium]